MTATRETLEWVPYDEVLSKPTWEGDHTFVKWLLEDKPSFQPSLFMMGINCWIPKLISMNKGERYATNQKWSCNGSQIWFGSSV